MKFKVGDKVRVCNPYSGSDFEDGDIVTIIGIGDDDGYNPDCYKAILDEDRYPWYLQEDEVCAVTVGDNIRRMTDSELADKFLEFFIQGVSVCNENFVSQMPENRKNELKSTLLEQLSQPVEGAGHV